MEIKHLESVKVLSYSLKTTLNEMISNVGNLPMELIAAVEKAGRKVAGAQIWTYDMTENGMTGEFTLGLNIPVDELFESDDKRFLCQELPPYKCLTDFNNGAWSKVGVVYEKMEKFAAENNLTANLISREVYLHCDFENEDNCVTEVQLSIN
jgi:effector-binding domain-containing protein